MHFVFVLLYKFVLDNSLYRPVCQCICNVCVCIYINSVRRLYINVTLFIAFTASSKDIKENLYIDQSYTHFMLFCFLT